MAALSSCFRCGQPYGQCAESCRGYKGQVERWIVRPSGRGWAVVHAETQTEAAWFADKVEAQKTANEFITEERNP